MGKRGPKPKPHALRKLEGNPGRLPMLPDDEVIAIDMPAVKPSLVAMDECASTEWDRLIACMPPELYTAADVAALTQYALAWSLLHKIETEIDTHGVLIEETRHHEDGSVKSVEYKKNPALAAWNIAMANLWKATDRLALYPGARAKLAIPKRGEAVKSKWEGLIKPPLRNNG